MMRDWKCLPAYKAEPRIDSFIGFYLPAIMTDFFQDAIVGIIPELPLRLGTIKATPEGAPHSDKSYKVDFFLLGESGQNYFVEFKTDSGSRRDKQDRYLDEARDRGMAAIVNGISRIASVSSYKKKYGHLLSKLKDMGLMDNSGRYIGKSDVIEIVYVQPHCKDGDTKRIIDFPWISKWLVDRCGTSEFETALSAALSQWAED